MSTVAQKGVAYKRIVYLILCAFTLLRVHFCKNQMAIAGNKRNLFDIKLHLNDD